MTTETSSPYSRLTVLASEPNVGKTNRMMLQALDQLEYEGTDILYLTEKPYVQAKDRILSTFAYIKYGYRIPANDITTGKITGNERDIVTQAHFQINHHKDYGRLDIKTIESRFDIAGYLGGIKDGDYGLVLIDFPSATGYRSDGRYTLLYLKFLEKFLAKNKDIKIWMTARNAKLPVDVLNNATIVELKQTLKQKEESIIELVVTEGTRKPPVTVIEKVDYDIGYFKEVKEEEVQV